jgi:hypothetical protein
METNTPANSAPMAEYPSLTAETQSKPKKVTTNGHQTPREKPTTPLLKPNPPTNPPPPSDQTPPTKTGSTTKENKETPNESSRKEAETHHASVKNTISNEATPETEQNSDPQATRRAEKAVDPPTITEAAPPPEETAQTTDATINHKHQSPPETDHRPEASRNPMGPPPTPKTVNPKGNNKMDTDGEDTDSTTSARQNLYVEQP